MIGTIGSSEILAAEFAKEYSIGRLVGQIVRSYGVDESEIRKTRQEKEAEEKARQNAAATAGQGGGIPGAPGSAGVSGAIRSLSRAPGPGGTPPRQ
jgi:hypothetical protein